MEIKKTFQGHIIFRMLNEDEKEFEKFIEEYNEHSRRRVVSVTPQFIKMAQEYKRGILPHRLMKEYGVNDYQTFYRIISLVFANQD